MLMTLSEQKKRLIQLSQSKPIFVFNVSAKFKEDQMKNEETASILI